MLGPEARACASSGTCCTATASSPRRSSRVFAPSTTARGSIVAPEALSRFYDGDMQARMHRDAKVGASWMTREDRLSEIADYIAYLDAVHESILARLGGARRLPVTVLGFSQGGATAARWVASGGRERRAARRLGLAVPAGARPRRSGRAHPARGSRCS